MTSQETETRLKNLEMTQAIILDSICFLAKDKTLPKRKAEKTDIKLKHGVFFDVLSKSLFKEP